MANKKWIIRKINIKNYPLPWILLSPVNFSGTFIGYETFDQCMKIATLEMRLEKQRQRESSRRGIG